MNSTTDSGGLVGARGQAFGDPPQVPDGPLDPEVVDAIRQMNGGIYSGLDLEALATVVDSEDARLAWVVSDLLRFLQLGRPGDELVAAFETLTGVVLDDDPAYHPWQAVTDHLIAWDLPAPPEYAELKRQLYLLVEPAWEPFFADTEAEVDWRLVSWGGVRIDDRPLGDTGSCEGGCIPALDNPDLVTAAEGRWYPDDGIVFGVVVDDEAVAFPKHMMEVHEMVNITIGGRRLGIPYCTLCGSAQAYYLDHNPGWDGEMVLRTSGLLARSNKMMYELGTFSLIDTFTGVATSGPLREAGVTLEQTTVVASLWGDWRRDHPRTWIVAEDAGLGRVYPSDPLGGRDDDGPIFPVGDVDPRLPAQEMVVGVVTETGIPVAFPSNAATTTLSNGGMVTEAGLTLRRDGSGFRAFTPAGVEIAAHQAFWFAWSQFHPDTRLWLPED
ncbi:MAG: DUF3179 domain-containing protein [Actinobacteria bacterium]|nr:DUF3179 domain-containing protein [Actinomycetota bacterium]